MDGKIPTDLIIRYLSNEATTEECEQLLHWVAEENANQKIFTEWTEAWNYQYPYRSSFDVSKGLRIINERIDEYESSQKKKDFTLPWARLAVLTLILSVSTVMIIATYHEQTTYIQYAEFRVSSGIDSVILSDGSRVVVNANSSIRYPVKFSNKAREVSIVGEAFFKVKRDTLRPFIVKANNLKSEVLGTSFNIRSTTDGAVVTVASGKVRVSHRNNNLILQANEKAIYSGTGRSLTKASSTFSELEWMHSSLLFQDTRLSEVSKRLYDHYGVTVLFENEVLTNCTVTGKFKNEPIDKVLTAICFTTGIQMRKQGKHFILSGPGCKE